MQHLYAVSAEVRGKRAGSVQAHCVAASIDSKAQTLTVSSVVLFSLVISQSSQ